MSDNIPPVAEKVVCIDFDGTIFRWGHIYDKTPPFTGAVDVVRKLKKDGWYIVILTSRMSPTWWDAEGMDFKSALAHQMSFIKARLDEYGIPFDRITSEKVPAEMYIDDKAIRFDGLEWSWKAIAKEHFGYEHT